MGGTRRELLVAVAVIAGGVLAFFLYLGAMGVDPDIHPLGLLDWVVGGMLIAPGFGLLIRWRRGRDLVRAETPPPPRA